MTLEQFLSRRPATSKEIQAATGMSQGAVSRRITALGDRIIRQKDGRAVTYMLTSNAFGGDDKLPIVMVDAYGTHSTVAVLRPLAHGGFYIDPRPGMPTTFLGESGTGLYNDLPYFLYDLAPQGFIGRQIAAELAGQSDFPSDPKQWDVRHIGMYLLSNGDDLPGNLKFGKQALSRVRRQPFLARSDDYPELAEMAMAGNIPGSSAGGEKPKFAVFCKERSTHVIVKFSPGGDSQIARRWKDILLTEHHASQALNDEEESSPAANTRIFEMDDRIFLESERFDRAGERGRLPMISLQYVDAEFSGEGAGWHKAMTALYKRQLISGAHLVDAVSLWLFGLMINNSDMHLGNLSLSFYGDVFRILPVYDMCSMGFAPQSGEVLPYSFDCPNIEVMEINEMKIRPPIHIAKDFWDRVHQDERISDELREFLDKGNPVDLSEGKPVQRIVL